MASMLVYSTTYCNGANILCIFPTPARSHQEPALALSKALTMRGHDVYVITPNPSQEPVENLKHIDIDLSYLYEEIMLEVNKKGNMFAIPHGSRGYQKVDAMPKIVEFINNHLYRHSSGRIQYAISILNGTRLDMIIYEPMMFTSLLGFADITGKPPTIAFWTGIGVSPIDKLFGNPIIPSYIPSPLMPFDDHMSFWERLENLFFEIYFNYVIEHKIRPINERYMQDFFYNPNRKLRDLEYGSSLNLIATDLTKSYPQPVQPNTIYVGPLNLETPQKPLTKDVEKWMDESEDGIIYCHFGSDIASPSSVPNHIEEEFFKAFDQIPRIRVIWKSNDQYKFLIKSGNVFTKKRLLQLSVLAHPKVRLFISQLDRHSFEQASYYGVPVLAIPIKDDQYFNARKLVNFGGGLMLSFNSLTHVELHGKITSLLSNSSYKKNMINLSFISKDKPMSGIDSAVWWVEYVLRHKGAPHLRPGALDLTWYQYYMLDILSVIVVIILIILLILIKVLRKIIAKLLSASSRILSGSNYKRKTI